MSVYTELPEPAAGPEPETQTTVEPSEPNVKPRRSRKLLWLAVVSFAGLAGWYFWGSPNSLNEADLAYLPNNAVVLVSLDVERLQDSELINNLQELTKQFAADQGPAEVTEVFQRVQDSMDRVLFGITSPGSNPNDVLASGVIHFGEDLPVTELVPPAFREQATTEEIGEWKLTSFGEAAYCQIDEQTIAFGNVPGLRAVLEREFAPATLTDAMDLAAKEADFGKAFNLVAAGTIQGAEQMKPFLGIDPPQGAVISANVDSDIEIVASLMLQNSEDIEVLRNRVQPFLEIAKQQSPEAKTAIDSLEFSGSGNTLTVSVEIPGPPLIQMAKKQASAMKSSSFAVKPAGRRLSLPGNVRAASHAASQQQKAAINAAIERFYFDQGAWPTEVSQLVEYVPDLPTAHNYGIDPETHRVIEVSPLQQVVEASQQAAAESARAEHAAAVAERAMKHEETARISLPTPTTPRLAFEFVSQAAKNGEVGHVLAGFTELGQREIAADLVESALQDIAVSIHGAPEIGNQFRELKSREAPGTNGSNQAELKQSQLSYLKSIERFMQQHDIRFAGLAKMYEPCELGKVAADAKWALGSVRYATPQVSREVVLGFSNSDGKWAICILDEIPSQIREQLEAKL